MQRMLIDLKFASIICGHHTSRSLNFIAHFVLCCTFLKASKYIHPYFFVFFREQWRYPAFFVSDRVCNRIGLDLHVVSKAYTPAPFTTFVREFRRLSE